MYNSTVLHVTTQSTSMCISMYSWTTVTILSSTSTLLVIVLVQQSKLELKKYYIDLIIGGDYIILVSVLILYHAHPVQEVHQKPHSRKIIMNTINSIIIIQ